MPARPRIGITLGDTAGIGPEIVAKALASGQLDRRFDYEPLGTPHPARATDAIGWIVDGARRCQRGELAALVTAPIRKTLLHEAGYDFPGQTELLAHLTRTRRFAMMLAGGPLRVALVTTHCALRDVADRLDGRRIREVVIYLVIDYNIIISRLTGRRQCPRCGTLYNLAFQPPRVDMLCDLDGEPLVVRNDDREDVIRERLEAYERQTRPVLDYCREAGRRVVEVDAGNDPPDRVFEKICRAMEADDRS